MAIKQRLIESENLDSGALALVFQLDYYSTRLEIWISNLIKHGTREVFWVEIIRFEGMRDDANINTNAPRHFGCLDAGSELDIFSYKSVSYRVHWRVKSYG